MGPSIRRVLDLGHKGRECRRLRPSVTRHNRNVLFVVHLVADGRRIRHVIEAHPPQLAADPFIGELNLSVDLLHSFLVADKIFRVFPMPWCGALNRLFFLASHRIDYGIDYVSLARENVRFY
jgi:hypothetical protein